MNYPNYPPQQPQYPPQQPAYPPGQPQYPPSQPAYPPSQPQYPPQQGYYPPQQQYAPPPPPQHFDIDDFYDQPAASGKSIAGWFTTPGQSISGVVARAISKADIRPQTDMQTKQPRYYSDHTPMVTMTIPLLVQPSADFPDGRAAWIVSASDRPDLEMAMQQAGVPANAKGNMPPPEAGAVITITFIGLKQIPGFGVPKKVKRVTYQRPATVTNGNGSGQAQQALPPSATAPAPSTAPGMPAAPATAASPPPQPPWEQPQQYAPAPPPPQYQPAPPQAPYAQDPYQQQPPPQQPPPVPPAQFAAPDSLTPEQAERLRQLTGQ
jgi:hypothetical protein